MTGKKVGKFLDTDRLSVVSTNSKREELNSILRFLLETNVINVIAAVYCAGASSFYLFSLD